MLILLVPVIGFALESAFQCMAQAIGQVDAGRGHDQLVASVGQLDDALQGVLGFFRLLGIFHQVDDFIPMLVQEAAREREGAGWLIVENNPRSPVSEFGSLLRFSWLHLDSVSRRRD